MTLLHWCTISPQGPSGLAAIRFVKPIRVSSIRVFPNGAQPFGQSPDIVACTEPESFFLEVFFNALPIRPSSDSKDKQRATNALVPTMIAYAGGQVEFMVDMGTEYATRLMIVKGKFEKLSMAIYGDIVLQETPVVQTYLARKLPPTLDTSLPLPDAVIPFKSEDPTRLAKELLALIPDSPPLSLVIRLMFCLKPSDEDWEDESFPYLYPDLETLDEIFDLESVVQAISRPIPEDLTHDSLVKFAIRLTDFVGPKSSDQSYQVARILSISASQHPNMSLIILQHLDLAAIFDERTLDETTVLCLLDAAANADIARHFVENDVLLEVFQGIQNNSRSDKHTQTAVRRLLSRIHSWQSFEDALSNTTGDFPCSAIMLKDIGTEEQSLGIWLESMLIHEDLITKLKENSFLDLSHTLPFLFRDPTLSIAHDQFINFVRTVIGIACTLAVCAWADSVGNDICRERSLAIMNLWQSVDEFREVLNHFLLLRQLTRRLNWITTDVDSPRKSSYLAERVLFDLANDPRALLQEELVKTILSLEPPLSFIAESERLSMRKVALVSDDGLPAAIEEITFTSARPFSLRRLRTLRVSLAIIERELHEDGRGEWQILQALWEEQSHGLMPRLVEILSDIVGDLNQHFSVLQPPRMNQKLSSQLFETTNDLMRLINHFIASFTLTSRILRRLVVSLADLYVCIDLAEALFSVTSSASASAQGSRHACLNLLKGFSEPSTFAEPGKLGAEIVLRTLLEHANLSSGRDPVNHLSQILILIKTLLPDDTSLEIGENSHWVIGVLPNVLSELKTFFRLLSIESQIELIQRLVIVDQGVVGIGEWLLLEELKHLSDTFRGLGGIAPNSNHCLVQRYQANISIRFISNLSISSSWCLNSLANNFDLSRFLYQILLYILEGYYSSKSITQFLNVLAASSSIFNPQIKSWIVLNLLRTARIDPTSPSSLDSIHDILMSLSPTSIPINQLRFEFGQTLSAYANNSTFLAPEAAENLFSILQWFASSEEIKLHSLSGITLESYNQICNSLALLLPKDKLEAITLTQAQMNIEEDDVSPLSTIELADTLQFSIHDIEALIDPEIQTPSTPRTTKTPDILGVVISPPTALLRSPAATGLTKTYMNNDFRQLRQVPQARLNTSRLPSMHVDVGINGRLASEFV